MKTLRARDKKAIEQSKYTDNYVVYYYCALWSSGRKSGYSIYKNGKFVENTKSLEKFEKTNKIEWLLTAKEIRNLIK